MFATTDSDVLLAFQALQPMVVHKPHPFPTSVVSFLRPFPSLAHDYSFVADRKVRIPDGDSSWWTNASVQEVHLLTAITLHSSSPMQRKDGNTHMHTDPGQKPWGTEVSSSKLSAMVSLLMLCVRRTSTAVARFSGSLHPFQNVPDLGSRALTRCPQPLVVRSIVAFAMAEK